MCENVGRLLCERPSNKWLRLVADSCGQLGAQPQTDAAWTGALSSPVTGSAGICMRPLTCLAQRLQGAAGCHGRRCCWRRLNRSSGAWLARWWAQEPKRLITIIIVCTWRTRLLARAAGQTLAVCEKVLALDGTAVKPQQTNELAGVKVNNVYNWDRFDFGPASRAGA